MRGIIFADGDRTGGWPAGALPRQLLPVCDQPMIHCPLALLLLARIRRILVVATPADTPHFQRRLGGGERWGVRLCYALQARDDGCVGAFITASEFIGKQSVALILADNIFHSQALSARVKNAALLKKGAQVFACRATGRDPDPARYAPMSFDPSGPHGEAVGFEQQPTQPDSGHAQSGTGGEPVKSARDDMIQTRPTNHSSMPFLDDYHPHD